MNWRVKIKITVNNYGSDIINIERNILIIDVNNYIKIVTLRNKNHHKL